MNDNKIFDLVELTRTMLKAKWLIVSLTLAITGLSAALSLLMPNKYESSTVFVSAGTGGQSSMASTIGQFSGLAQLAGVSLPGSSGNDLTTLQSLIVSRSLRERLILKLKLTEKLFPPDKKFGERNPISETDDKLKELLNAAFDIKTNSYRVKVETESAELSKEILDQYLVELEYMLNEYNVDSIKKTQMLMEKQVREQSEKLTVAQKKMVDFQTKNKILNPTTQSEGYFQLLGNLTTQKIQFEIQLRQYEDAYNLSDTRIQALKNQIASIETQIKDIERTGGGVGASLVEAPELMIEYQNLFRDVEISQRLYSSVLASLEQSRISFNDKNVFIRVIDSPYVPDIKSGPNRSVIVLLSLLASFFGCVLALYIIDTFHVMRKSKN